MARTLRNPITINVTTAMPPTALRSLGIVLFTTVAGALVASLTALPVLLKGQHP
jgi:hypothetical protein